MGHFFLKVLIGLMTLAPAAMADRFEVQTSGGSLFLEINSESAAHNERLNFIFGSGMAKTFQLRSSSNNFIHLELAPDKRLAPLALPKLVNRKPGVGFIVMNRSAKAGFTSGQGIVILTSPLPQGAPEYLVVGRVVGSENALRSLQQATKLSRPFLNVRKVGESPRRLGTANRLQYASPATAGILSLESQSNLSWILVGIAAVGFLVAFIYRKKKSKVARSSFGISLLALLLIGVSTSFTASEVWVKYLAFVLLVSSFFFFSKFERHQI